MDGVKLSAVDREVRQRVGVLRGRVVAALVPAASTPLTLLTVQFWIAAVGAWALRYGRWLLRLH